MTPTPGAESESFRALAETIAREVGTEAGRRRREGFEWSTKSSSTDVVTEIDTWAEDQIVARIRAARPNDGFIGEEGTNHAGTSGIRWIIDPIDGTTNLLYDIPGWAVSIAVANTDQTLAGAVHDPIRNETFSAASGYGATRNGESIGCSTATDLSTALVGTGFAYLADRRAVQAQCLTIILPVIRDIRRMGGAALDLCAVACGRTDACWERGLSVWDSAAGALIAAEAGAVVTEGELTWAAAPRIADAFAQLLDDAGA